MSDADKELKLRERRGRAHEAEMVLTNPLFQEAFHQVEALYTKEWATSPADDPGRRERAYYGLNALRDVKSRLTSAMRDGIIVAAELEKVEDEKIKELIGGE